MKKYLDIKVGDKAEITHKITQQDIDKFVELTGDDNKIHTDSEYASKTTFKKPVAHGMLGASFISTIIGTKLPGDGALWFAQSLEFLLPVRIGDKLRITAEVVKKVDRTHTIELNTDIYNQNKQKVTTGTAKVKVIEPIEKKNIKEDIIKTNNVLVIGGTGGIGSATCLQLAKDGFNVAIHYHNNKKKAEKLKNIVNENGNKAVIVTGNMYNTFDVDKLKNQSELIVGKISVFCDI